MQRQSSETGIHSNSRPLSAVSRLLRRPSAPRHRFVFHTVGTALLLGIALAYEPAMGDGTTWTLPYTGSASVSNGPVFSITNTYTDNLFSGGTPGAISGVNQSFEGYGVYGESAGYVGAGVSGKATNLQSYGVLGVSTNLEGDGVRGEASGSHGVGVFGWDQHGDGTGVSGYSYTNIGVTGNGIGRFGVYGTAGKGLDESGPIGNDHGITSAGVYGTMIGTNPVGVWGDVKSAYPAVYGTNAYGVGLQGVSGTPATSSAPAIGTYGVFASTYGSNTNGQVTAAGVYGGSNSTIGVMGVSGSSNDPAIYGFNGSATGDNGVGVFGHSVHSYGVYGTTNRTELAGVYGTNTGNGAAVVGVGDSASSPTGYFLNNNGFGNAVGLQGQSNSGLGVVGYGRVGVYGASLANGGFGGYFQGDVQVTGTLSAATKHFKIDHPLDPTHKYLVHASVESSEQLNTYSGNIMLNSDGKAVVDMPQWFEAENGDCRYQLTCVGGYAPVYIDHKMQNNRFAIAGGKPGLEVSWQVMAVRQDAYARHHPLQVEQEKSGAEAGKYLNPEDYGKPASEGMGMQAATANLHIPKVSVPSARIVTPNTRHVSPNVKLPKMPDVPAAQKRSQTKPRSAVK